MATGFVHLHTHSSHSVRDSIARPDDLFDAVVADGQSALAITDHGNLSGLHIAHDAAATRGVSLIAGLEAYMAIEDGEPDARLRRATVAKVAEDGQPDDDKKVPGQSKYTHLTLLAENATGLENLLRLSSAAHEGAAFWSKPRLDLDVLGKHSDGIIALSGCLGGAIKSALARGDTDGAYSATRDLVEIFGKENFFIEVMSHGIAIEDALNAELLHIAKRHGLRVVATNDSHFTHSDDRHSHEAWLCGARNQTLANPTNWGSGGSGFHLRSSGEMRGLFDDEPGFESACDTTLVIAERATGYEMFPKHGLRIPKFDPDGVRTADELLYERVRTGAVLRYGSPMPAEVKTRLRYESDTISNAGLSDYFLIVADMIDWAKDRGIRVGPGRGSAAGSCVSYCMGITAVDPIQHGLLFERFLNPTRNKMPDIDTDFEQGRRQEVVNYLIERWGRDSVALIGTLGYSLAKNSLRVASKVLGEGVKGTKLADQVPTLGDGKTATIARLSSADYGPGAGFRNVVDSFHAEEIVKIAERFEGVVNTESIHACGVVIGEQPILGQIPLRADRRAAGSGGWVSEFDGEALEKLGYLKMDVLGLLTLDIVEAACREIERRYGRIIDVDTLSENGDDAAKRAWALIGSGLTDGLFQLDSGGMQDLARRLNPKSVDELAVLIALYRPGPLGIGMDDMYANRKAGTEEVTYDIFTSTPSEVKVIRSVLDETLAVIVYQEQILRIAELVAGFNPPERDNLLRAIGKKIRAEMDRSGALFIESAQSNRTMDGEEKLAFSKETADNLWDAMKSSGEYSFNKSHSVGYARLSFITAWLKANYPVEYAAGWLARADSSEKRLSFLAALSDVGVTLRAPDVNLSGVDPIVDADGAILFGLGKIRDVGTVAEVIIAERSANGPFMSLADFAGRVRVTNGTRRVSVTTLRALIESGGFDAFGTRKGQFDALETLRKDPAARVSTAEWGVLERSARERIRLGVLVSQNPLVVFKDQIKKWQSPNAPHSPVTALHHLPDGGNVHTLGVVISWEIQKRKTTFAKMTLAGTKATIDCVVWNNALTRMQERDVVPKVGDIVGVDARVQNKAPYRPDILEDGTEADLVTVQELVVASIWSHELIDHTVVGDDVPDEVAIIELVAKVTGPIVIEEVIVDDFDDVIGETFDFDRDYDAGNDFDAPPSKAVAFKTRPVIVSLPAPELRSPPCDSSVKMPGSEPGRLSTTQSS
jgi:DNA polymerase-3 subunit alpha